MAAGGSTGGSAGAQASASFAKPLEPSQPQLNFSVIWAFEVEAKMYLYIFSLLYYIFLDPPLTI